MDMDKSTRPKDLIEVRVITLRERVDDFFIEIDWQVDSSEWIAAKLLSLLQSVANEARDNALEEAAKTVEGNHLLSSPIGPLYGVGWEAGIECSAAAIRESTR